MFTGIISELGTVRDVELLPASDAARLVLHAPTSAQDLDLGASLAVNGTCLTAASVDGETVTVDVMGETLRRTTTGALAPGDTVNLERCVPAAGRLDGHIVQGHVDATGRIVQTEDLGGWRRVRIQMPVDCAPLIAEKGSIAVDGVSLTVTAVSAPEDPAPWFEVGLIPETLHRTRWGGVSTGAQVNLEVDVIARYTARLAAFTSSPAASPAAAVEAGA